MEYSLYYRSELKIQDNWQNWDLFLSAYNLSHRITEVYNHVEASQKLMLIFPEYSFVESEILTESDFYYIPIGTELDQLNFLISTLNLDQYKEAKICVDITGFMRPSLLLLLRYFKVKGYKKVDFLYSEPNTYAQREKTEFTCSSVSETRQVIGYSGVSQSIDGRDLLIIASGYDSKLIGKVAQNIENAEIVHMFGFPSLQPDMYQENILQTIASGDSFNSNSINDSIFAPASDPFETASIIKEYIISNNFLETYKHIYISPLSTMAQTLGIGLMYLNEFTDLPVSIIYPFTDKYAKWTSIGIGKIWSYTVEFD